MKKTLLICGTLLALTASLAQAQGGINFAWNTNGCLSEGGTLNRTSTCSSNFGSAGTAVGSYVLNAAQNLKVGDEIVIDLQTASASLPNWFQFFNAGSCRSTALSAAFAFGTFQNANCFDPWSGQAFGGVAAYQTSTTTPPVPSGLANAARVKIGAAVANPIALPDGLEFYSFAMSIGNANTTTCTGCATRATIVLNEIASVEQDGSRQRLSTPLQNQCIGWQGLPSAQDCGATPTLNKSWGQVKSLYR